MRLVGIEPRVVDVVIHHVLLSEMNSLLGICGKARMDWQSNASSMRCTHLDDDKLQP